MTDPADKILSLDAAVQYREKLHAEGRKLVLTNGCFDLLHRGHAQYLYESRLLGDALLILINADESVRELKGPSRPIVDEYNRAYMLAALEAVSAVVVFHGKRCTHELAAIRPDIYVKGGDYTVSSLDPEERAALENGGAEIRFKPFVAGFSTSNVIRKIKEL